MRFLASVDAGNPDTKGVPRGGDGGFRAWSSPHSEESVDLAACSSGFVVPEPRQNLGLVVDCETLLSIRDTLAGGADLEWNENVRISIWEGVTLGGSPPRVHELKLVWRGLTGELPPGLGRLTELRRLDLRGTLGQFISKPLIGAIPPELGNLAKLEYLDLSQNFLSGRIPPELANLTELSHLYLSLNFLSGSIPLGLAGLSPYLSVDLEYNTPELMRTCRATGDMARDRETLRA